jgi:hypothetical protein
MRASGIETSETAKGLRGTRMAILTLASSNMERRMEKGFILGRTGRYTMVNGIKASSKGMEFGKEFKMTVTSVSGALVRLMGMEFIPGPMETGTRVNGRCALSTVLELIISYREICILVSM